MVGQDLMRWQRHLLGQLQMEHDPLPLYSTYCTVVLPRFETRQLRVGSTYAMHTVVLYT